MRQPSHLEIDPFGQDTGVEGSIAAAALDPLAAVPPAPVIARVDLGAGEVSGTGEVGATINLRQDDSPTAPVMGTAVVGSDGRWTISLDFGALAIATYQMTAYATNADGQGGPSNRIELDVRNLNGTRAYELDGDFFTDDSEILIGGALNDTISGQRGADIIQGAGGDDRLSGGSESDPVQDIVIYSGARADYDVSRVDNLFTIQDLRSGAPDGRDRVEGFEVFRFADGDLTLAQFLQTVPNAEPEAEDIAVRVLARSAVEIEPRDYATDDDADYVSLQSYTQASNGVIVRDGQVLTYVPNDGFVGTDTFTYTVSDGYGGFDTATVTITVESPVPQITGLDVSTNTASGSAPAGTVVTLSTGDGSTLGSATADSSGAWSIAFTMAADATYSLEASATVGGQVRVSNEVASSPVYVDNVLVGREVTGSAASNERIVGGSGDDVLIGGRGGPDILIGGDGDDTLHVDAGDTYSAGAGVDTLVYNESGAVTLAADLENLLVGDGDTLLGEPVDEITVTGNALDNRIDLGAATGRAVVVFSGARNDYSISIDPSSGAVVVTDLRPQAPDGVDTIVDAQIFRFADGDIDAVNIGFSQGDALPTGGEQLINTTTAEAQNSASVAALTGGGFVTVWRSQAQDGDSGGIYARLGDADGRPTGVELQVNSTTAGAQYDPTVTGLADGGFVVAWTGPDGDGTGIFAQRYSAAGVPLGDEVMVTGGAFGNQIDAQVNALSGGGYIVSWTGVDGAASQGVFAQRYDAAGDPMGGRLALNTTTSSQQNEASVRQLSDGSLIAVWTSNNQDGSQGGVYAQIFNTAGVPVGGEFLINNETEFSQSGATILPTASGFIVAWQTYGAGLNLNGQGAISFRMFDNAGAALGAQVNVDNVTAGIAATPNLVPTQTGGFLLSWTESRAAAGDGDGATLIAQSFRADGSAVGPSFIVNETWVGGQSGTEQGLVQLADGSILAVWSGTGLGDTGGVYARRYDMTGMPGNDLPDVGTDSFSVAVGGTYTFDALANDSDANGDRLIVVGFDQDFVGGSASLTQDGLIVFQADEGFEGEVSFSYFVSDGSGQLVRGEVTATVGAPAGEITGTAGDDTLVGTPNEDVINGLGGDDTIDGLASDDVITGGAGADRITGGAGADRFVLTAASESPNSGFDRLLDFTTGEDQIDVTGAGVGKLFLQRFDGSTFLYFDPNDDGAYASEGVIRAYGDVAGTDILGLDEGVYYYGDAAGSHETLNGSAMDDVLAGLAGDDALNGGAGIDWLYGGDGADVLSGGAGADALVGGAGADRFVIGAFGDSTNSAWDTILEFEVGTDLLDLSQVAASAFLSEFNGSTFVYFDPENDGSYNGVVIVADRILSQDDVLVAGEGASSGQIVKEPNALTLPPEPESSLQVEAYAQPGSDWLL